MMESWNDGKLPEPRVGLKRYKKPVHSGTELDRYRICAIDILFRF